LAEGAKGTIAVPGKAARKAFRKFEITGDHIRSWVEHKILAVLDLDFYAQIFGIRRLIHQALGDLLQCPFGIDAKDWGRAARAKAAEAMRCLDVLAAQIAAKTGARESGPK
jgi:hypothetical protein